MNSKTERLDELFRRWESSCGEPTIGFARDGIIEEEAWDKAQRKVLFLFKETNKSPGDFRKRCSDDPWPVPGYWAYGLQNVRSGYIPPFTKAVENYMKAFRSSALVNLKKEPGGSAAKMEKVEQMARRDAQLISEELGIIQPEIVVCGGNFWVVKNALSPVLPGTFELIPPDRDRCFVRDGVVWIDYCHPTARWRHDMMYYGLVTMYQNCLPFLEKHTAG